MKAWIGNLAAYNNGQLVGEWVGLHDDADAMAAQIRRICGDVEHFVADYDGAPAALVQKVGEYANAEALADAAALMSAMEDATPDACDVSDMLDAFIDADGYGKSLRELADEAEEWIGDHFAGIFDTVEAYAADLLEETGALDRIPEDLRNYFDFAAFGRDLVCGGDITTRRTDRGLMIFRSN